MTNFNRSGFNPLRPNPNAPQQNRQIGSPAQEPQNSSRPAGHHEAGPSDTQQEARPQNQLSAANVAIHQRARFDQQSGNAVARADAPEAPIRKKPPLESLPKILKGLEPYKEGKKLGDCELFSGLFSFGNYFNAKGGLKPAGVKLLYERVDPPIQAEIMQAIEMRKAVLAGGQSSVQGNVQNAAAAADPGKQDLPKILKGLEPYKEGKTLQACETFLGSSSFRQYFYAKGGLASLGKNLYEMVDPSIQAEIREAIEIRKAVLARGQSSAQENVQNTAAAAPADPGEQELADIFSSLPDLIPNMPEPDLFSQPRNVPSSSGNQRGKRPASEPQTEPRLVRQRTDGNPPPQIPAPSAPSTEQTDNVVARTDAPKASTRRKFQPESLQKMMKALEPYKEGKTLLACDLFSGFRNFRQFFRPEGGLKPAGLDLYEGVDPSFQAEIREAIEIRKAVLAGGQSSTQGAVQGNVQHAAAQAATHERARFLQQRANVVARANAPEASTRLPPPTTPSHGGQMPETPQDGWDRSRLPPSHTAPEIVDVDNYPSPPAATVSVAQRLANDPWLRDNDFVSYNQMLAELLRGQPGADRLHFVDPQQVQLLLNGDPAQKNAALRRLTGPNTPPILFLPVNNNIHWSLLVVDRETEQAFHYDSMASPIPSQFSVASKVADALGVREPMEMPMAQQPDTYSCGDHVLTGIEELAHRVVSGEAFQDGGMNLSMIQPNRDHIVNVLTHVEQFERGMPEPRLSSQPRNVPSAPSHLEPATRRGADDMT